MRQIIYDKVKYIADKYKGYIDTEDLMKEGLTNRQIGLLTAEGKLEKVAHGHYWIISPEFSKPEDYKAVEVARVNRKAVICADSACYYMGLIDKEPEILSIATRRSDRHKMKMNFEVSRHYFSEQAFEDEKHVFDTKYGSYNVYGIDEACATVSVSVKTLIKISLNLLLRTTESTIRRMKNVSWHMQKQCVLEDR